MCCMLAVFLCKLWHYVVQSSKLNSVSHSLSDPFEYIVVFPRNFVFV